MVGRNAAKYETLSYVYEVGLATTREIAEHRNVTHGCQATLMRRYWWWGFLNRCSGEGREKIYSLSDRGVERLEWLESEFEGMYFTFQGVSHKRCRVKREEDTLSFLRNIKRCRVVKVDDDYIEVERGN